MNKNVRDANSWSTSPNLRVAQILTVVIVLLAAVASAGGLLIPDLYREPAALAAQMRGQDLVTLMAALALVATLVAVRRGSARATVVWIGLLGYMLYTYVGAAFAYAFNAFFLIYVALFSLSVFALIALASQINAAEIRSRFDAQTPRTAVVAFLLLLALMLCALWLGQIIPFLTTGTLPAAIEQGGNFQYVYALDLGLIVPLSLLGAIWLWRRKPWGYILSGYVLLKAATMGLALLAMTWFTLRAGLPAEVELAAVWALIAAGGLGLSVWFLRHCRGQHMPAGAT
jgi:hypothetical protein